MKNIFAIAAILALSYSVNAQEFAKGVVFNDTNKNGIRDKKEVGIPSVSVSNGIEVVQTDTKGNYTLPVTNDNIIFVIKPSDYTLPLNNDYQPQFYYIHKPEGSPELNFKGVSPTGRLPKEINFALTAQKEKEDFSAFVFGDPQAYDQIEMDYFKRGIIDRIADKHAAVFGISLGDLVGNDLSLHPNYKKTIALMGLPWFNVIGNHDLNFDTKEDIYSDESFEASFGPANYSFNYANAHFIVLDDIIYPNPDTGKGYKGGFRKEQLDFIENDLKFISKDKLVVLAFHIPLAHESAAVFRTEDRDRLFNILASYPHTLSLSAHTHFQQQNFFGAKDGWKQEKPHHEYNVGTTSGDWYSGAKDTDGIPVSTMRDGTPKGYAVLNIKNNQYTFDYHVVGKDTQYQIALSGPSVVDQKYVQRYPIYANFFIGKGDDQVLYRINEGKWKEMETVNETDPAYNYAVDKFDFATHYQEGRRPSDGAISSHLWKFNLPKLKEGKYKLEVKATDMFNRVYTATKEIEVLNR
ncbi:calcineurin-like phosphoesterase C-terminal domain-containing protein [Sphingobacterium sp. SRCM116780]|uniref:calcineurin-like phosphoesterase C-terminal domain-containing protein n=1 Tax=Sphingobacterium sp. SRCM116780 TaxID=2907623 RepID=UPI001F1EEE63|nr:calcineurin-like phosphoesterase C-terminal domain-containing protein [Sphingobacterium sp. SRCM116780]UIR56512.1 calcineurin-like phosphoesterase C-terminal domain-containing protein [Sphingobacterium sp. SRCM116780]